MATFDGEEAHDDSSWAPVAWQILNLRTISLQGMRRLRLPMYSRWDRAGGKALLSRLVNENIYAYVETERADESKILGTRI